MTKDTPVYQVDFWRAPSKGITWATNDCKLYGESSGAFQLCVSPQRGNIIVAGWKPCVGVLASSGTCQGTYAAWDLTPMWVTFVAIYRRKATVTTHRGNNTILGTGDFGEPEIQNITAAEFSTAFDSILYTWKNSSTLLPCEGSAQDWQLTEWIYTSLLFNAAIAPFVAAPLETLRNLFMAPLYLYNPVTFVSV
ncbi:hypothetical protein BGZ60DRAFT_411599 [Tricladium varicosporioides]|nr:hypothetical protein BGZ60DRAFT_411599 [Hymenoscyphus varicosporioides]